MKLNKSYEREPIEVQMRALPDKKKDLESKIDAFLDEARKTGVQSSEWRCVPRAAWSSSCAWLANQAPGINANVNFHDEVAEAAGIRLGLVRRVRRNRSEEHTSELQSRLHLVCRLLLEKKKNNITTPQSTTFHDQAIRY